MKCSAIAEIALVVKDDRDPLSLDVTQVLEEKRHSDKVKLSLRYTVVFSWQHVCVLTESVASWR